MASGGAPARPTRLKCEKCGKASVHYCSFCQLPHVACPRLELPLDVDVLFCDRPQKATGLHAKLLAPSQVRIVDLFTDGEHPTVSSDGLREIPRYDPDTTLLGYPGEGSVTFAELPEPVLKAARRLVVIDSPWKKSHAIQAEPALAHLQRVQLGPDAPESRFWRYHAEGNDRCLSTIEALSALLRDAHLALQRIRSSCGTAEEAVSSAASASRLLDTPAFVPGLLHFFDLQLDAIGNAHRANGHDPTSREAKEAMRVHRHMVAARAGSKRCRVESEGPSPQLQCLSLRREDCADPSESEGG